MKRLFALLVAMAMLFCLGACKGDDTSGTDASSGNAYQSETTDLLATESITSSESVNNEATIYIPQETENHTESEKSVFNTEDIVSISLSTYYGEGEEHPVPSEHMEEITNWIGSFTIDRMIEKDEEIPPGSNFYWIKIKYSDGTVVESGLSIAKIGEDSYYINSAKVPECFWDILS